MKKKINAMIALMLSSALLLTGCVKDLKKETTLKKIKDITAQKRIEKVKELTEAIDDYHAEKEGGGEGSVTIGMTHVSLSCPVGWSVDVYESEDSDHSDITAYKTSAPKYDLIVKKVWYLYDKDGNNIIKSFGKKVENMTKEYWYDFDESVIKDIKEAFEYELLKETYPKWTEVSFEETTINHQVYVVAKGKIKSPNEKKSERGGCWYITVRNGEVLTFQFEARHPEMDASVIDIFEGIMESVTYS